MPVRNELTMMDFSMMCLRAFWYCHSWNDSRSIASDGILDTRWYSVPVAN